MSLAPITTFERKGRSAVVHVHGDLVIPTARRALGELRIVARRRDIKQLVLDFSRAGRLDSAGIAVVSLVGKQLARQGKTLELAGLDEHHRVALALMPTEASVAAPPDALPGAFERIGAQVLDSGSSARALFSLIAETARQAFAVGLRRKQLPAGALGHQIVAMGLDALLIVGLLSFMLGMTMAFQGAVQLQRFGAGVFVADMISMTMVREIGPLMTAVILTGRTGAAIAAELGTMRVRSEIDALTTMGINPARFLIVPRLAAITFVGPALSLMAMVIGMVGGMVVAVTILDIPPVTFWGRMLERLTLADFGHGMIKSLLFAWIIGITGCHLGMRASGDASSVGAATTRTVVVSIFCIIIVDGIFATVATLVKHG